MGIAIIHNNRDTVFWDTAEAYPMIMTNTEHIKSTKFKYFSGGMRWAISLEVRSTR
jgi:hypothetical protein